MNTPTDTHDELEQQLLNDKSFQHILKLAPQSQRELMTYELATYFEALITTHQKQLLEELLEYKEQWATDSDWLPECVPAALIERKLKGKDYIK